MEAVAAHFGKHVLREVELETVESHIGELRRACGDRAVLRALRYLRARMPACWSRRRPFAAA